MALFQLVHSFAVFTHSYQKTIDLTSGIDLFNKRAGFAKTGQRDEKREGQCRRQILIFLFTNLPKMNAGTGNVVAPSMFSYKICHTRINILPFVTTQAIN